MTGVLLMAHGTPSSLDEMPEYLTRVRGGRPPSPDLVAEMRHNYEAIGGRSPLTDLTLAQGAALHERLGLATPVAVSVHRGRHRSAEAQRRHPDRRDPAGATVLHHQRAALLRCG
jgi:protoheme ferro-lyase